MFCREESQEAICRLGRLDALDIASRLMCRPGPGTGRFRLQDAKLNRVEGRQVQSRCSALVRGGHLTVSAGYDVINVESVVLHSDL